MTSRASAVVSAYAYRQGFQWSVQAINDHAIEPTANTLAGSRCTSPRSGVRPGVTACASDGSLSTPARGGAAVGSRGVPLTTGRGGRGPWTAQRISIRVS
jgi:hypothetical protein